jgi:hypothetical protein
VAPIDERSLNPVGIRVRFPGRTVAGVVVTELSDEYLREFFGPDSGLAVKEGTIELPRAVMNRSTPSRSSPPWMRPPTTSAGLASSRTRRSSAASRAASAAAGSCRPAAAPDLSLVRIAG